MRKTAIFIWIFVLSGMSAFSQQKLTWEILAQSTWEEKYYERADSYVWYPDFSDTIIALEGKEVYITGYMIPVDVTSDFYVLSKNPYESCFFCGQAGPETVIQLWMKNDASGKYKTDELLTFKGILRLNKDDLNFTNFILEDAEPYEKEAQ